MKELIQDTPSALLIKVSAELATRLAEMRIYRNMAPNAVPSDEKFVVPFSKDTRIEPYVAFDGKGPFCSIGSFSYTYSPLQTGMTVGRHCSIAAGLQILGERHPIERVTSSAWSYKARCSFMKTALEDFGVQLPFHAVRGQRPPTVGNDVWIGQHVMLAREITIGDGAVIGAGAIVTKDVEPFAIIGGVPARMIRRRFSDTICERMTRVKWWDYNLADLPDVDLRDPERFLDEFELAVDRGLQPYRPHVLDAAGLIALLQES